MSDDTYSADNLYKMKNDRIYCGCDGSGIILAVNQSIKSAGPYVFRCNCPVGQNRTRSYPLWGDSGKQFKKIENILQMLTMNPNQ